MVEIEITNCLILYRTLNEVYSLCTLFSSSRFGENSFGLSWTLTYTD